MEEGCQEGAKRRRRQKNPPSQAGLLHTARAVLYLGRCYLPTLLVKRQHHGEPVPQGKVIPCEVKALAALVGPDRADARPNFLPLFVLTRASAVVEDIRWCVWHRNVVSATA